MKNNQQLEDSITKIEHNFITYSLKEIEKTASIIDCKKNNISYFIPRSIRHKTKEYIIKSIEKGAFSHSYLNMIQFAPDSMLEIIEKEAFAFTSIKRIKIPSEVRIISENSFFECRELEIIEIPNDSKLQTIEANAFNGTKRLKTVNASLKKQTCGHV